MPSPRKQVLSNGAGQLPAASSGELPPSNGAVELEKTHSSPTQAAELLDNERLHSGPISFELADRPLKTGGWTSKIGPSPTGRWYHSVLHTVTAVVGVGVLGLPYAFSYLTWAGGLVFLSLAFVASLYTSWLLAALHEEPDGRRHNRYVDLGVAVLGPRLGAWVTAPFQWSVMVGLGITYTVTAGQSFQGMHDPSCSGHTENSEQFAEDNCHLHLTGWIILFGVIQAGLSQLKDFHSLWWMSLLGATMSVVYSAIAFIASAVRGTATASYAHRPESVQDQIFGAMSSLGTLMFAYGGQAVLLEIQATLATPPASMISMMRGVYVSYVLVLLCYFPVAIAGYASFGNTVNADVLLSISEPRALVALANFFVCIHVAASYQVFAQPLFEYAETAITQHRWPLHDRQRALRLALRTGYVCLTTLAAVLLPFFADLMGLISAAGFVPLCFVLPCVFWVKAKQPRGVVLAINVAIILLFSVLGLVSGIASLRQIIVHAGRYRLFH